MTKVQSPKPLISRRFLAFLLTISFLVSALPSLWFARLVMADGALAEDGHNVYHDEEEFDLFHTVGEERWRKKIQYLYAETIEGSMLPVYCVMAGAPSPENGSITPSVMQDPAARELLGKIQCIIDMDSSMFQVGDTVDGHPHMHYYVKQLLIWHLIYLYQDGLASDSQQYFKGIDVRSFLDVDENGPTAMVIINEANRLWDVYDAAGRPALEGAYTPHYKASVKNISEPVWN